MRDSGPECFASKPVSLKVSASKGPLPPKDCVTPGSSLLPEDPLKGKDVDEDFQEETACSIICQVFIPLMFASFSTVAAVLLLDIVQNWKIFQEVPEMFVLVPALLVLKGNVQMTLVSRISTLVSISTCINWVRIVQLKCNETRL
ncbi:Solute carrier family 41 member 1 [Araneus ventricosus]|uniref:Solute carrier family 41 member 1 n=1 Tax=Araneus ventricosus TaxID=182803 RepID=A0A4Y2NGN4_ARAVE|nr:Solute carrier family 41 member 1 [Araneus ventricosus]